LWNVIATHIYLKIVEKQSKRQPARLRYKVEKKFVSTIKKQEEMLKKNPKKNKQNIIQVPNICPFKEDILKEVEAMRKQKEEEKQRQREAARLEKQKQKEEQKEAKLNGGLDKLAEMAEARGKLYEHLTPDQSEKYHELNNESSLKQYYKEFKKVIEAADVILEVVDARDPLGTRCIQVEQAVRDMKGNKKACQRKFSKSNKGLQGSSSVGAELLMSLLANYCRNKGIKTSIKVGVVGLPNVGKSSIINSLKRSRACNVGALPGITRAMQEVQLDSKIKLLDSPGIVFAAGNDSSASLRNAVRISALSDPITPANSILQRVTKNQMMEMYNIPEYSTPDEFYSLKAKHTGRFKKGGIPDSVAAAKGLLEDWNNGKIKYHTVPPEENETNVHISSSIVTDIAKEFDLDSFEQMEIEVLNKIEKESDPKTNSFIMDSLGPVESVEEMKEDLKDNELLSGTINVTTVKKNVKNRGEARSKKIEPEMTLEGNQKLNQIRKKQFKKEKKQRNKRDKVAQQLASGLENFSLNTDKNMSVESYDFDKDFTIK
ncbi:hypothetical protein NQ314_019439, partial [Rhamnusium bicolor]